MTREEELDWLCRLRSEICVYMPKEWLTSMNNALDMAIQALEQEPTTKNDPGVELISRKEVIEQCQEWRNYEFVKMTNPYYYLEKRLSNLTPITPQESKSRQFAEWVATEIFDDMWEYNKDAFAEIACRKLEKLGIVRAKGDEWELVDSPESEE